MAQRVSRRGPSTGPLKHEWVGAALRLYQETTIMIANWDDGITGQTRKELSALIAPTEDLLIRAKLIGQRRHGSTDILLG